jgi:hypothetical protein
MEKGILLREAFRRRLFSGSQDRISVWIAGRIPEGQRLKALLKAHQLRYA